MKSIALNGRDELLQQLRPVVAPMGQKNSAIDSFQSETIQPILEVQMELVLAQVKDYLKHHKTRFHSFNRDSQRELVRELIQTDFSLRNLVIPMVTGMFTLREFRFYSEHRAQVARRILNLAIRKVQDRIESLY